MEQWHLSVLIKGISCIYLCAHSLRTQTFRVARACIPYFGPHLEILLRGCPRPLEPPWVHPDKTEGTPKSLSRIFGWLWEFGEGGFMYLRAPSV